ncbi:MAG: tRNA (guanosine(37)-N1)-methyltransferase TrmD [Acetatifactor sp.]|nr:tRNA (guanosine(37)-N1)-methyltransferase TrmD [Acetatifactor sp.]MDE7114584.1 tRNA (guanosine(37)-N1)-methyltransferase TrmD [Acetatifactor sp.]
MKFHVLTLFPEMVDNVLNTSIIGRAVENNHIEIHTVNIRDYTQDKHGKVDDYTYGGGAGMLMQAQPVYDAWKSVADCSMSDENVRKETGKRLRTIYVTPQGIPFTQSCAMDLAQEEELVFLCGHYEGIDARVLEEIVTDYVSIGDYVLTGGELPAMVMIDAVARLVPGVLHNDESAQTESFHRALLEYPQYSRPEVWHEKRVPEVLLSGDHRKISAWRLEQSKGLTKERRPDLYAKYIEQEELIKCLSANKRHNLHMMESLSRGRGEILVNENGNLLIYDRGCRICMLSAKDSAGAERLMEAMPCETEAAVTSQIFLNEFLRERMGFQVLCECKQACYTERSPLPVRHRDIRLLGPEHLDYLTMHYEHECREYLAERIRANALWGAFLENRLVGFAGSHTDGSLGILYVEESCRGQRIGASLEAFCINRHLELGYVPYGHICADNETSLRLQERLGLYLSTESIWWLEKPETGR